MCLFGNGPQKGRGRGRGRSHSTNVRGAELDVRIRDSLALDYHKELVALVNPPIMEIIDVTSLAELARKLLVFEAAPLQGGFDRMVLNCESWA